MFRNITNAIRGDSKYVWDYGDVPAQQNNRGGLYVLGRDFELRYFVHRLVL